MPVAIGFDRSSIDVTVLNGVISLPLGAAADDDSS